MIPLLVAAGAAVGAPARYVTDALIPRSRRGFPTGTFVINVVGSLLLGLVAGLASRHLSALFGTGFCGAFTTYSTFSQETGTLWRTDRAVAVAYVVASLVGGLGAAAIGLAVS